MIHSFYLFKFFTVISFTYSILLMQKRKSDIKGMLGSQIFCFYYFHLTLISFFFFLLLGMLVKQRF